MLNDRRLIVAFDVDDTLIIPSVATGADVDLPNYKTIAVYRWFQKQGHYMVVWSGGGIPYAKRWAEKLNLKPDAVWAKMKDENVAVDIAFDDCDVDLARVNVKVKRHNNQISRADWNKH